MKNMLTTSRHLLENTGSNNTENSNTSSRSLITPKGLVDSFKGAVNKINQSIDINKPIENNNTGPVPDVSGPQTTGYNPDPNSINQKLDSIIKNTGMNLSDQDMETFKAGLSENIMNNMGAIRNNFAEQSGYNQLQEQQINQTQKYFDTISQLPGYAQIRKKYMDEVSNDDLDFAIKQVSANRDSAYSMVMSEAYKRGDNINPYEIQQQADQMRSMYNSQINELIKKKENRREEAKTLAKDQYTDLMKRVELSGNMLDRLNQMKQDAYQQVQDGVTDSKWLAELDNTISRTKREFKMRERELSNQTGINNANLLLKMKEYEKQYGESISQEERAHYYYEMTNQRKQLAMDAFEGKENPQKVAERLQENAMGYNVFDTIGNMVNVSDQTGANELVGKKGGSVSRRTNNPGNIKYSSDEVAKWLGAIGIYSNHNNLDENGEPHRYMIFENPEQGAQASAKLIMYGKSYQGKTVAERLKTFQGGSTVGLEILKRTSPDLLNKKGNFTDADMQTITNAIQQGEGWEEGTSIDYERKKDEYADRQNQMIQQANVLKDRGLSWKETQYQLEKMYQGNEDKALIAQTLPQIYTEGMGTKDDEITNIRQKLNDGAYLNTYKDGTQTLDRQKLINDIIESGEYVNAQSPIQEFNKDLLRMSSDTFIGDTLGDVLQIDDSSLYVDTLKEKGMSNDDILNTYLTDVIQYLVDEEGTFNSDYAVNNYLIPLQKELLLSDDNIKKKLEEKSGSFNNFLAKDNFERLYETFNDL